MHEVYGATLLPVGNVHDIYMYSRPESVYMLLCKLNVAPGRQMAFSILTPSFDGSRRCMKSIIILL